MRAKLNEIDNKETIEKINETKNWFFKKSKNIDTPLANLKEMHTHKHTEKGDQIKTNKQTNTQGL